MSSAKETLIKTLIRIKNRLVNNPASNTHVTNLHNYNSSVGTLQCTVNDENMPV